jgi:hypothetical protein
MAHILRVAASVVACAVLALPASAGAQDTATVSGLWSGSVLSPEGQHPISVAVVEQDGRLVGVLSGAAGQVPLEGTRTGDSINLRFSVDYQGAPLPITLTAKPGADALSGTADFGGQAQGTWSASRVSPTGISGAWTFSADAGNGPIPGALTLLEEGGKVNGRLLVRSHGVDGVVTGTNGNGALTLKVDATVDGSPVTIDLPGKVDGATSLSGTFAVGDMTGRWSATRP